MLFQCTTTILNIVNVEQNLKIFLMRFHNLFYLATIFISALVQSRRHHFLDLECFSPIVCIVLSKYLINVSERDNMLGYLWGAGNFGACVFSTNSHLITSAALEWWAATSSSLPQLICFPILFFHHKNIGARM